MTSGTAIETPNTGRKCQRAVRRRELRRIVPLADTTIYEMERRGDFPQRFYLTSKCAAWNLDEVETWLTARRAANLAGRVRRAPDPDVRSRRNRPVREVDCSPALTTDHGQACEADRPPICRTSLYSRAGFGSRPSRDCTPIQPVRW